MKPTLAADHLPTSNFIPSTRDQTPNFIPSARDQTSNFKLFALLFLLAQNPLHAQPEDFGAGLLFEDDTYDALPRQSAEDGSKADLPSSVDLTPYCPEVRHQGYIFSCVGWSAGYAAMSIQRAILNRCTDREVITRNAHSALFLYNQIKTEDCKQGARISDALRLLSTQGDCLARQFDFEVNNCEQVPDSAVAIAARRYAIQDFLTLFGAKESGDTKVIRVKKVLATQKPVVVGMNVLRNFYDLKNAQYWHPTLGNTTFAGGHAMTVVGYDDRREAFRLMNSWGKNWGDGGFIWVKYSDFGQYCKYAYALYLLAPASFRHSAIPSLTDQAQVSVDSAKANPTTQQPSNPTTQQLNNPQKNPCSNSPASSNSAPSRAGRPRRDNRCSRPPRPC